ncbi:MAG: hypothetical protein LBK25_09450 [Treponema sp.]|jgi:hypothetical protein|nr:hypothetical protein [Treponema sp.]
MIFKEERWDDFVEYKLKPFFTNGWNWVTLGGLAFGISMGVLGGVMVVREVVGGSAVLAFGITAGLGIAIVGILFSNFSP